MGLTTSSHNFTYVNSSSNDGNILICAKGGSQNPPAFSSLTLACSGSESATGLASYQSEAVDVNSGVDGHYSYVVKYLRQDSSIPDGFSFRVTAQNNFGWSIPTKFVNIKPRGVPHASIFAEVLRAAGSDNSIIAYWEFVPYPNDRAARVTHFIVQWA